MSASAGAGVKVCRSASLKISRSDFRALGSFSK